MAVRQIRIMGDEILTKKCKPVKAMNERTMELIEDMFETMYQANGCGLAAPQVGVLKQIVTIDVDDGNQYVLINPEITAADGSQTGYEGCLSLPGKSGIVTHLFPFASLYLLPSISEIFISGGISSATNAFGVSSSE